MVVFVKCLPCSLTQNVYIKRRPILHNRVTRIVPTLRSAAQLNALAGNDIDDFAFAFITPLRSKDNSRHGCVRSMWDVSL
jgi:hypothetical protein